MIRTILVLLMLLPWSLTLAQDRSTPPTNQIDDLTPPATQTQAKRDTSDELRIPDVYLDATGGPDRYGYTYTDSDSSACTYDWIDMPGTHLALDADEATAALPIGFAFPFYDTTYTQLTVDSNGALLLQADDPSAWQNAPLGSPGPSARLAPFWDDLQTEAAHYTLLGAAPHRTLAVTFDARRAGAGPLRFQVLLREDGHIRFQYQTLSGNHSDGASASVGIQGPSTGLGYLFNGYPAQNRLHAGLAVCFAPPDGLYLSPGVQRGYAQANQDASFTLWAINQTGADGTFDLSVESPWPAAPTVQRLSLPDGESRPLTIRVRVPAGTSGERVTATVTLTGPASQASAAFEIARTSGLYGYTGASASDEAAIFDLQTATLVDRLSLLPEGDYPYDATMTPDGSEVWIPGAIGDGVIVIDTATNSIIQRVAVGEYPVSVAFRQDGAYAFVANRDTEDVTVVDTASYAVVDTIPLPTYYLGAGNLALNPDSGDMYVVDWYGDYFWVLDPQTFTVTQEVLLGSSLWQLVVSPLGNRLYITDRGLDVVHVLDTADLSVLTTIPTGDDPWGIDITPDGTLIYVTNEDSHNLTVIDATNNSVVTTVALPHGSDSDPRDVDFSANGRYAYVTSGSVTGDDEVYVLDTSTHTVAARISVAPAGNPNVVAVAPQMSTGLGLLAAKTATPEPVILGDPLTYTISFNYTGLVSATNVLVTDTLPAGVDYVASSGGLSSTYDVANHQVIWDLGDLPAVSSGELTAQRPACRLGAGRPDHPQRSNPRLYQLWLLFGHGPGHQHGAAPRAGHPLSRRGRAARAAPGVRRRGRHSGRRQQPPRPADLRLGPGRRHAGRYARRHPPLDLRRLYRDSQHDQRLRLGRDRHAGRRGRPHARRRVPVQQPGHAGPERPLYRHDRLRAADLAVALWRWRGHVEPAAPDLQLFQRRRLYRQPQRHQPLRLEPLQCAVPGRRAGAARVSRLPAGGHQRTTHRPPVILSDRRERRISPVERAHGCPRRYFAALNMTVVD